MSLSDEAVAAHLSFRQMQEDCDNPMEFHLAEME